MLRLAVSKTSNIKVKGQMTMGRRMMEGENRWYRSNRSEILCWGSLYQIQAKKARRRWVEGQWREMIDNISNRSKTLCWGSLYQIQAILKRKARRRWVEGWWRETIDDRSNRSKILCGGSLYQIQATSKGQKDDGRRETVTWQKINKQKNFKMLFVCMFVWLLPWLGMWHSGHYWHYR